ncbi:UDP-N-acetylgalactosamine-undecaprenyl-phosphate N-acetylgalactosaminephosphotransferase [Aquisphaera giovannonii]|uniref:UDP-N-acetylgalactosamine-undecaprenyl-phosphate N-acetylgalactosaminephosphotransferase n=1 Tax=Aquisphaera giovannonii TaxID=406548 RepID=A0A5B9WCA4_9BACT|nr:sugar transferase [Aquisphaera giovannonii]QEH37859.1 UDP-N-acetylgalactosamine-undecaprenyl-phosphate N-acetylgalactosaminephosphotransferase [Aquisphaera giovannonii]
MRIGTGSKPRLDVYGRVKRGAEIALSALLLFALWPVGLLCMVAVRMTSSGSPLYSQRRLGYKGRIFTVYKIRTMYLDCEKDTGAVWSKPGDSRVTPVGRFLRKTHLDELPQLFNILRGDMSFVGPRPERPEIASDLTAYYPDYHRRTDVRPGLTGLAQVLLPPDTERGGVRRKLELDFFYIEHGDLWMDLKILILGTPLHIIDFPRHLIARCVVAPPAAWRPSIERLAWDPAGIVGGYPRARTTLDESSIGFGDSPTCVAHSTPRDGGRESITTPPLSHGGWHGSPVASVSAARDLRESS